MSACMMSNARAGRFPASSYGHRAASGHGCRSAGTRRVLWMCEGRARCGERAGLVQLRVPKGREAYARMTTIQLYVQASTPHGNRKASARISSDECITDFGGVEARGARGLSHDWRVGAGDHLAVAGQPPIGWRGTALGGTFPIGQYDSHRLLRRVPGGLHAGYFSLARSSLLGNCGRCIRFLERRRAAYPGRRTRPQVRRQLQGMRPVPGDGGSAGGQLHDGVEPVRDRRSRQGKPSLHTSASNSRRAA